MLGAGSNLPIRWADSRDDAVALAQFFVANAAPEYISHGELQDGRAEELGVWSDSLGAVLVEQFSRAFIPKGDNAAHGPRLAVAADPEGRTLALGFVRVERGGPTPYAVVEDLLVRAEMRSAGIGARILKWIEEELCAAGVRSLFLESSMSNFRAHHFLTSNGFLPVSKNFMKVIA